MGLRDSIKLDAKEIFANETDFAEPIVYEFRSGGVRPMSAVVDRSPPGFYGPGGEVLLPRYTITVPQSCTNGVMASEIDQGDTVKLAVEFGDIKTETLTVMMLQHQDLGMNRIALR